MRILLGTTPQQITGNRARPLIQNLGPGNVYVDTDGDVDSESGFFMIPNSVYEFSSSGGNNAGIWVVADAEDTDVRVIGIG